jgi:hypothetical protein
VILTNVSFLVRRFLFGRCPPHLVLFNLPLLPSSLSLLLSPYPRDMASAIPIHSYHPPRHPHGVTPKNLTPASLSTSSYYTSSSTSTQRSSYWSNGPSSVSTTSSSTASPRFNPGLAAAQYVTKHATSRLHKRPRQGHKTPEEIPDELFDEGFFSGPGSPPPPEPVFDMIKSKAKIKPLLKKVSGTSRNNSLDLSRSDGGLPNGVIGLGIYDSPGYDSSGIDDEGLETAFPKYPRKRHHRNFSALPNASVKSPLIPSTNPNQSFAHPKRQIPRRGAYTPDLSCNGTSNESSDDSSDEQETRRIVLSGSNRSPSILMVNTNHPNVSGHSTPIHTAGGTSMTDLHSYTRARTSSTQLASPIIPISPVDSVASSTKRSLRHRGRQVSTSSLSERDIREASPSFAASVAAARLAWEAKEFKKEEKRERKRRRSEAKGESRTASRASYRTQGNSDSIEQDIGTIWNSNEEGYREKDAYDDEVYTGRNTYRPSPVETSKEPKPRDGNPTGKKWGILSAEQSRKGGRSKHAGLKKHWLGFIVWVRIGMVRLGRKMGF